MPSLFVIGDSISMQYGPQLERFLGPGWRYDRKRGTEDIEADTPAWRQGANGGDSDRVLAWLRERCAADDFRPDVLLFNCGLHDLKLDADAPGLQVPPERYRANLEAVVGLIPTGVRPVWVRTTPVDEAQHAALKPFRRREADVVAYNQIADTVMTAAGIPLVDLYGFSRTFGPEAFTDGVHFREEYRPLQGAYIAGVLHGLHG